LQCLHYQPYIPCVLSQWQSNLDPIPLSWFFFNFKEFDVLWVSYRLHKRLLSLAESWNWQEYVCHCSHVTHVTCFSHVHRAKGPEWCLTRAWLSSQAKPLWCTLLVSYWLSWKQDTCFKNNHPAERRQKTMQTQRATKMNLKTWTYKVMMILQAKQKTCFNA
jgi:hypothetical protein